MIWRRHCTYNRAYDIWVFVNQKSLIKSKAFLLWFWSFLGQCLSLIIYLWLRGMWHSCRHRYSFSRQIRFLSIIMSLLRRRPWQERKMFLEFSTCNRSTTKLFSTYLQQGRDWRDRQRQLRVAGFQKRDQILEIMKKLAQTGRERTGRVKGSIRDPRRLKKAQSLLMIVFSLMISRNPSNKMNRSYYLDKTWYTKNLIPLLWTQVQEEILEIQVGLISIERERFNDIESSSWVIAPFIFKWLMICCCILS